MPTAKIETAPGVYPTLINGVAGSVTVPVLLPGDISPSNAETGHILSVLGCNASEAAEFQWQYEGADILGATDLTFDTSAQPAGNYRRGVSDGAQGMVYTAPVTLGSSASIGTFKVYINQIPTVGGSLPANSDLHQGSEIVEGGIVEGVSPLPLEVTVDDLSGFSTDDPRKLWIDVDYGERYPFQFHAEAQAPAELRMLRGTEAGYYPGFASAHAVRGVDMTGASKFTIDDISVDQTVTVTVTDGLQTQMLTFTARIYNPDRYYEDLFVTSIFPTAPEDSRRGIVYFSRDGDFTGALPARPRDVGAGITGIYHYHVPDGRISPGMLDSETSHPNNPGIPFRGFQIGCIDLRFKGGEEFALENGNGSSFTVPGANNSRVSSWGNARAILTGETVRTWNSRQAIIRNNGGSGLRFVNVTFKGSDYDPSLIEDREWWNILPYTGKTGTFAENSSSGQYTMNGEVVSNGNGVFAQVIGDTGSELIVRQVVDNAATDDLLAQPSAFLDGDTLTGGISGATATFINAGARQDRTKRWPAVGFDTLSLERLCIDGCRFESCHVGINYLPNGGVLSDTWINNWFDYGLFNGVVGSSGIVGCVFTQPYGYVSEPRDFGVSVAGNRVHFNTVRLDDMSLPMPNAPTHTAYRTSFPRVHSMNFCMFHSYGGHGAFHQPVVRMATGGHPEEELFCFSSWGNAISGGAIPMVFGAASDEARPKTAKAIQLEGNHYLALDGDADDFLVNVGYSGTTIRNCLLEYPASGTFTDGSELRFIDMNGTVFPDNDPDLNPKDIAIEFNTFVFDSSGGDSIVDAGFQEPTLRGIPVTWRNNAYIIADGKVGSIAPALAAINDAMSDYDMNWRPSANANSFEAAIGDIPGKDAFGIIKPGVDASKGAFEPA